MCNCISSDCSLTFSGYIRLTFLKKLRYHTCSDWSIELPNLCSIVSVNSRFPDITALCENQRTQKTRQMPLFKSTNSVGKISGQSLQGAYKASLLSIRALKLLPNIEYTNQQEHTEQFQLSPAEISTTGISFQFNIYMEICKENGPDVCRAPISITQQRAYFHLKFSKLFTANNCYLVNQKSTCSWHNITAAC